MHFFCKAYMNRGNRCQSNDESASHSIFLQPFSSAVVAYQESITHIHSCHHRIIVDDDFGLLDILASNPSLDPFFVMSASYKTNVFLVFLLYNYQVVGQFLAEKGPLVISLFLLCLCYSSSGLQTLQDFRLSRCRV
jgi:hypothetical protein